MKIVFFSDIHGNKYAFESFLKDLTNLNYDLLIFGGDVFGYYYYADEIWTKLREIGAHCLLGNHDMFFLQLLSGELSEYSLVNKYGNCYKGIVNKISNENIEFIKSLKSIFQLTVDELSMVFVHGSIDNHLNGRIYPDTKINNKELYSGYDFIFMGHTHHKMEKCVEKCKLINSGSLGQQRDGKGCSYIVFDTSIRQYWINTVAYNVEALVNDINKYEDGEIKNRLIDVLYR